MHIFVLSWFYPPVTGGAEVVAEAGAKALSNLGHRVGVLTSPVDGTRHEVINGIQVERHPGMRLGASRQARSDLQKRLTEILRTGVHVIHSHMLTYPMAAANSHDLIDVLDDCAVPWVDHAHNAFRRSEPAARRLLGRCRRLLAVSCFVKRRVQGIVEGLTRLPHISVLPNPVCCDTFAPSEKLRRKTRKRLGLAENSVVVFYPSRLFDLDGSLSQAKQPRMAFAAVASAASAQPRLKLLVASPAGFGGPQAVESRRKVRQLTDSLQLDQRVVRVDEDIPHHRMSELYNAADLTLIPSPEEGFGLCFLESLACATPVLGFDGGAVSEVTGGCARLVPANSKDKTRALASELVRYASNSEALRRDGRAGRAFTQSRPTVVSWARRLEEILLTQTDP